MRARAVLAVALPTAELVRGQGIGVGGLKAAVHQPREAGLAAPARTTSTQCDKERCCQ